MRKIILTIAAVAVVSSCSIYRKYQRPENVVPVDSLYRAELVSPEKDAQAAEDSTSFGYMPWEEMFTDPHLQALIRQGLDNNTDLLSAALRVQQAQARLTASKWAYSPSLNLSPQVGYNYSLSEGNGTGSGSYNLGGAVSWDIDLFGSLLNAKRGAQAALLQQEAYRQAVRSQLIATIANTYYSLLMLDEQVRVSEENVALWAEQIRSMEAMLKVGRVNENAVTQSRAQLYGLEASRADAASGLLSGNSSGTALQPSRCLSGRDGSGQCLLFDQSGPFGLLSQAYPFWQRRMDQQCGTGDSQPRRPDRVGPCPARPAHIQQGTADLQPACREG